MVSRDFGSGFLFHTQEVCYIQNVTMFQQGSNRYF